MTKTKQEIISKTKHRKKRKKSVTRQSVLKMLAVMENAPDATTSSADPVSEFLVTGRTGRRNAMADILGPHATTTSGDLPARLEALTTTDSEPGPSNQSAVNQETSSTSPESSQGGSGGGGPKS